MKLQEYSGKYVAMLRALYLLHQNHHWFTSGFSFYGNHLLFERLYKLAQENADLAAEKLIGVFGADIIDAEKQPDLIQSYFKQYIDINKILDAEKSFLNFSQEFYDLLKDEKKLSLGLDDAIMGIASDRESAVYLLQQIMEKKMDKLSALAKKFQIKLAQMSVDPGQSKPEFLNQTQTDIPRAPMADMPAYSGPQTPLVNTDPLTGKPLPLARQFKMEDNKPKSVVKQPPQFVAKKPTPAVKPTPVQEMLAYDPVNFDMGPSNPHAFDALTEAGPFSQIMKDKQQAGIFDGVNVPTNTLNDPMNQGMAFQAPVAPISADVYQKLDTGVPYLKRNLQVIQHGPKNISVQYNADKWSAGVNEMRKALIQALPGYTISDIKGLSNPEPQVFNFV